VGDPAPLAAPASPVKYHYFRRFFTYSVKRKKAVRRRSGHRAPAVPIVGQSFGVEALPLVEFFLRGARAGQRAFGRARSAEPRAGGCRRRRADFTWEMLLVAAPAALGRARSVPKTLSGGEFDWGGTSVKR
jgi:hypothetical protein